MAEQISRRTFVRGGAVALTLSAAPALITTTSGRLANAAAAPQAPWARSRFTPLVGATFRMTGGGEDVHVVLTDVRDLSPVRRQGDEDRFALLFAAASGRVVADGIRRFRHKDFGQIDMFVSPAGQRTGPLNYQVIINRL